MRDYKRVSPRFWAEAQADGWSDDMKMLALYLLTCEHRTTEGLYRLPVEYMAADLSGADGLGADLAGAWSPERVRAALARLTDDGFVRYDHAARVVFLPRALAYQAPENPNQRRAAIKSLRALPETPLLAAFLEAARDLCPKLAREFEEPFAEGSPEPLGESPAPTPAPTPEEHVAAGAAAASVENSNEAGQDFGAFWSAYPRKVGKAEARRRWNRLTKKDRSSAAAAAGHLAGYVTGAGVDLQYVPHPGTFIGPKRSFEDWAEGLPPGYAAQLPTKADEGPIRCLACKDEITPDDFLEAAYVEGRGWLHRGCRRQARRSA